MKSAYVKPTMMFEGFQPTEYVAACYYVDCIGTKDWVYPTLLGGDTHNCEADRYLIKDNKDHVSYYYGTKVNTVEGGHLDWSLWQDALKAADNAAWGNKIATFFSTLGVTDYGEAYLYDGHLVRNDSMIKSSSNVSY